MRATLEAVAVALLVGSFAIMIWHKLTPSPRSLPHLPPSRRADARRRRRHTPPPLSDVAPLVESPDYLHTTLISLPSTRVSRNRDYINDKLPLELLEIVLNLAILRKKKSIQRANRTVLRAVCTRWQALLPQQTEYVILTAVAGQRLLRVLKADPGRALAASAITTNSHSCDEDRAKVKALGKVLVHLVGQMKNLRSFKLATLATFDYKYRSLIAESLLPALSHCSQLKNLVLDTYSIPIVSIELLAR